MATGRGESSTAVHHVEENAGIDVDVSGTTHTTHAAHAAHAAHATEATAGKHFSRVNEIVAIVVGSALPI